MDAFVGSHSASALLFIEAKNTGISQDSAISWNTRRSWNQTQVLGFPTETSDPIAGVAGKKWRSRLRAADDSDLLIGNELPGASLALCVHENEQVKLGFDEGSEKRQQLFKSEKLELSSRRFQTEKAAVMRGMHFTFVIVSEARRQTGHLIKGRISLAWPRPQSQ